MEWKMEHGFKIESISPFKDSIAIACWNFEIFNDVDVFPISKREDVIMRNKKMNSLVGVWKPKGSPSLLS